MRSRTRLVVLVKRPNKAVMALGDRVWAAAEGLEGRGAVRGRADCGACSGLSTGESVSQTRAANGSRLQA